MEEGGYSLVSLSLKLECSGSVRGPLSLNKRECQMQMQARQLKAVSRQTGLLCSPLKAFFYCGAELPGHSSTVELSQGAKTKMTLVLNSVLTVLSPAQAQVARRKRKMMEVWKTSKKVKSFKSVVSSEGALYVILPYDYPAAAHPLFEHTPVLNDNFEQ